MVKLKPKSKASASSQLRSANPSPSVASAVMLRQPGPPGRILLAKAVSRSSAAGAPGNMLLVVAVGQYDRAMLQDRPAGASLGTAGELTAVEQHVRAVPPVKTEERPAPGGTAVARFAINWVVLTTHGPPPTWRWSLSLVGPDHPLHPQTGPSHAGKSSLPPPADASCRAGCRGDAPCGG